MIKFLIICCLVFILPGECLAIKVGPAEFNDAYTHSSGQIPLRGAGLKKFVQLKVFASGLYLPSEIPSSQVLSDVTKRLEVVYLLSIPKEELHKATIQGIKANTSPEEFKALTSRIKQINDYYPDVKRLDRIEVTYTKGIGSQVSFNGKYLGTVKGADFARAFFAIWIGDHPVDVRLKKELLKE